jgi:Protein of unknown function (DUF4099)/Protein of unknown function (DUF3945)
MENKFKIESVDWRKAEQFGITKELIANTGNMEKLLNGEKTNLLKNLRGEVGNVKISMDGKVRLYEDMTGNISFIFHGVKAKLDVPQEYLGYKLTESDKAELLERNTLSRKVSLIDISTKQPFDAYLGVDKDTREVIALRANRITIPQKLKGVELTPEQKSLLADGKPVLIVGMQANPNNDKLFSALVQINVGLKGLAFTQVKDALEIKVEAKEKKIIELGTAQDLTGKDIKIDKKEKQPIELGTALDLPSKEAKTNKKDKQTAELSTSLSAQPTKSNDDEAPSKKSKRPKL